MTEPRKLRSVSDGRDHSGRFSAGNPGKPRGARRKINAALDRLFAKDGEAVAQATLEAAKAGDIAAARLVLERIFPAVKDRPLGISLPDHPDEAMRAIVDAAAAGDLLIGEAERLAALIKTKVELTTVREIEERLAALEAER